MEHYFDFGPEIVEIIEKSPNIIQTPIYQLKYQFKWFSQRVVFIGDAIHAVPPNLAQGACLAIEDAFSLASLVYKRRPLADIEGLFKEFQNDRAWRAF